MLRKGFLFCGLLAAVWTARANPVVFLHGYNSDASIWSKLKTLLISNDGYTNSDFLALSYYKSDNSDSSCSTDSKIETVAEFVAREIKSFYVEKGSQSVDIVCHSMGGLVVRTMLANALIEPECIRRYIPIATPQYGQNVAVDTESKQMKYGSKFLWNLAEAWHFKGKTIAQTLCIAGTCDATGGSCWDGLVHSWSVALGEAPCRYVDKCHSSSLIYESASAIYACKNGKSDPVYKLVKAFLATGTVLDQSALNYDTPSKVTRQGRAFYQVVDATNAAVAYASSVSSLVTGWATNTSSTVSVTDYEHGVDNNSSQQHGIELAFGEMPVGTYTATVRKSSTTPSFTVSGIPIKGGRTTVMRMRVPGHALILTWGGDIASIRQDGVAQASGFVVATGKVVSVTAADWHCFTQAGILAQLPAGVTYQVNGQAPAGAAQFTNINVTITGVASNTDVTLTAGTYSTDSITVGSNTVNAKKAADWAMSNSVSEAGFNGFYKQYLLNMADPSAATEAALSLAITEITYGAEERTVKVQAKNGVRQVPLSTAINGTLAYQAADTLSGLASAAIVEEALTSDKFIDGQAIVTVPVAAGRFIRAWIQ